MTRFLTGLLIGLLLAPACWAHKASDGFVYLDQTNTPPQLRIDLALRDLALVVPLDRDDDRQVSGRELQDARAEITHYLETGVTVAAGDATCALNGLQWGLTRHSDGPYAAARYAIDCPGDAAPTRLTYRLLFEVDSLHRGLVQRRLGDSEQLAVLGPDQNALDLTTVSASPLTLFGDFLYQGIVHLVFGFDHVLFLLVLILPATLVRRNEPQRGPRRRLWELAGIVTAFTVAHSITLGLAAMDVMRPPIAWIEIVIALSIALAALNLFFPIFGRHTWRLAFGFGLIHGFGFASVLGDLTSGTSQTVLALAGFNIGVELGQIALLLLVFPLLYACSRLRLYQRAMVPALALAVSAISLYWVVERVAGLSIA
ncbi:HupE/UreJ family protein [Marinobacter bohaiensis]|uniref:HupE/UreJ family protein n=1 Tax=Marinobacter bohaiensis TaxID=2201898 RepID=UPI000DAB7C36|nr:HupE/UreJ family protein [Marinobacter bohaiensis]